MPATRRLASAALCLAALACDDGPAEPPPTGVLRVTTETTGLDVDPDVYVFTRDGVESLEIDLSGSVDLADLAVGTHTIQLSGVAPHCAVVGRSTRSAEVGRDDTVVVAFEIGCPTALRPDVAAVGLFDGDPELYVISLRSLRYARLTNNPGEDQDPEWSPDGARIVFASNRDGVRGIHVMNADGSGARPVFEHPFGASGPDWSPDASRFVFLWDANFYSVAADGTGLTQLTFADDVRPLGFEDPQWSPNGARIAYAVGATMAGGINKRVEVMNADGSAPR